MYLSSKRVAHLLEHWQRRFSPEKVSGGVTGKRSRISPSSRRGRGVVGERDGNRLTPVIRQEVLDTKRNVIWVLRDEAGTDSSGC
jgi:hypothetical protein